MPEKDFAYVSAAGSFLMCIPDTCVYMYLTGKKIFSAITGKGSLIFPVL